MMGPTVGGVVRFFLLTIVLFQSQQVARADDAKVKYEAGVKYFKDGEYTEAATAFRAAWRMRPSWKVLFNLGQSEAAAKRYGLALEAFEKYLAEGGDEVPSERKKFVLNELESLRKMVGSLEVIADEGSVIFVDDIERGKAPVIGKLTVAAAVKHRVYAVVDGEKVSEQSFKIRGQDSLTVNLRVNSEKDASRDSGGSEDAAPEASAPAEETMPTDRKASPLGTAGIVTTAVGGCALLAAIPTGIIARNLDDELSVECTNGVCPPGQTSKINKMENLKLSTNVLLISGGAVAAVGISLVVVNLIKGKKGNESASLTIVPSLSANYAGLTLERRF